MTVKQREITSLTGSAAAAAAAAAAVAKSLKAVVIDARCIQTIY